MFSVILMLFLLAAGIALLVKGTFAYTSGGGSSYSQSTTRNFNLRPYAAIPLVLLLFVAFFSFTSRVEAKQVGVLTTFGKPASDTYSSGLAFHWPWQEMTQIDATTQNYKYHGENSIQVILSDKNTANISASIRWAVNQENANTVFADFRSNDPTENLGDSIVSVQFKAALNSVFNTYDATAEESETPEALADKVKAIMDSSTESLVDIKKITISYIKPGKAVQRKIDQIQTQRSATKVANEKVLTAIAEAKANEKLSDSISNDPNVLVSKCFDLIADGAFDPPAGFSCWPGGGSGVIIPSTTRN